MDLVESLIRDGWLKTPRIIEAFRKIKRADFLPAQILQSKTWAGEPEDMKDLAELNEALPIGQGQTISQPLTVAFMLEQLQPEPGQKILDIGSGSGWTTAILAEIVSQNCRNQKGTSSACGRAKIKNQKGRVIAIEIIQELKEFGEKNVAKYNFIKKGLVEFICADGSKGYQKEMPFDRILVSAAVQDKIPSAWKEQLKIGGRLVAPIANSIWVITKKSEKDFEEIEYPGFVFVPLI